MGHDADAALNEVLSEVIDVVADVKQAYRKVPQTHALHAVLGELFSGLGAWAGLLIDQDGSLGVSPLSSMPSVAGRRAPNLWAGSASDEEVRTVIGDHLERLAQHVAAALAEQEDPRSSSVLAVVARELSIHRRALAGG